MCDGAGTWSSLPMKAQEILYSFMTFLTLPRRAQLLMRDGQSLVALVENSVTTFTDLNNAAVSRC